MTDLPADFSHQSLPWARRVKDAVAAAETAQWFFDNVFLGGDGVVRFGSSETGSFDLVETSPPSMSLTLQEGGGVVQGKPVRLSTPTLLTVTPASSARHDIIAFHEGGRPVILKGSAGVDPVVPAYTLPLWRIVHRVGESSIKTVDDGTNGYIEDLRSWVN